jgi:predicted ATPase/class 3 adenylate cyclase
MAAAPSGTVTLLFTDIEGSTRLLQRVGDAYSDLLSLHRELLRGAFADHGGYEVDTEGDAFFVAFASAREALAAAAEAQRVLAAHAWPEGQEVRVRMGLHTGEPRLLDGNYVGLDVHQAARVMAAGHGGQVLLSQATQELLGEQFVLRDLGEHRLKDLSAPQHLYQLQIEGLPSVFPALKTLENRPTNLPVQPTPLIGREQELEQVATMLLREDVRLLTLTGPGGTGKTRLALQAAANLIEAFSSGVYFVSLSPIRDPTLLIPTVAETLGLREQPGEPLLDTVGRYTRGQSMLLLLDNLEQITEAAPQIASLAQAASTLKVLATSRAPLRLAGEHLYPVPPLALPDRDALSDVAAMGQYEAVRLFAERAQAVRPEFAVTGENAPAVAEICLRLDGLPLAIELAAARIHVLSPQAMLSRLDQRLKLLTGGGQDLDQRQQTLRATIQWSFDLLSTREQTLFARLSVFVGGCRLDAAEAVCDPIGDVGVDVLDGLSSLVEKSLLRQRDDPDGEPRFWMLETIREFAAETAAQHADASTLSRRHLAHFSTLSQRAEPGLRSAGQERWISLLRRELGNLRAALDSVAEGGDTDQALALIANLGWFWDVLGAYDELRARIRILVVSSEPTSASARALYFGGFYARRQGDLTDSEVFNRQSLDIARRVGDVRVQILALAQSGWLALVHGDTDLAAEFGTEAVDLARVSANDWEQSYALNNLAHVHVETGGYEDAGRLYEECATILRRLGDKRLLAAPLANLANVALIGGDVARAAKLYQEALTHAETFHDLPFQALNLVGLGWTNLRSGRPAEAEGRFLKSIRIAAEMADPAGVGDCLRGLAAVDAERGQPEQAAELLATADALVDAAGVTLDPLDARLRSQVVASIERELGAYHPHRQRSDRAVSIDEAVALAEAPPRRSPAIPSAR